MGYYINEDSKGNLIGTGFSEKIKSLTNDGAKLIPKPTEFTDGLVCVVDNGFFAAAAYAYSESEMNEFLNTTRQTQWLYKSDAKELAK